PTKPARRFRTRPKQRSKLRGTFRTNQLVLIGRSTRAANSKDLRRITFKPRDQKDSAVTIAFQRAYGPAQFGLPRHLEGSTTDSAGPVDGSICFSLTPNSLNRPFVLSPTGLLLTAFVVPPATRCYWRREKSRSMSFR